MAESDETARAIVAGQTGSLEVVKMALSNVCFGSKADIGLAAADVRYPPKADIDEHDCHVRFVPIGDMSPSFRSN